MWLKYFAYGTYIGLWSYFNLAIFDNIKYINGKYGNNEWLIVLKDLVKELKIHNVCCLINRLKGQYKTFFTNIKKGIKTNKPSTKKLKYISEYSIILDNYGTYIDLNFKQQHITGLPVNIKAESVKAIFPGCNENVDPIQCSNGEFLINGYIHNGSNLENVKVGVFNGEFIAGNYYNVTLEESK